MKTIALIDPPHDLKKYENWKYQWMEPDSITLTNYISECCHPEDFLICTQLLIPTFVVIDGCVIIKERYQTDNFSEWRKHFFGNKKEIEKMLNNIVVYDVFLHTGNDVSNVIFEQICNVMKVSWSLVLNNSFPDKKFIVDIYPSTQENGPSITFYQK